MSDLNQLDNLVTIVIKIYQDNRLDNFKPSINTGRKNNKMNASIRSKNAKSMEEIQNLYVNESMYPKLKGIVTKLKNVCYYDLMSNDKSVEKINVNVNTNMNNELKNLIMNLKTQISILKSTDSSNPSISEKEKQLINLEKKLEELESNDNTNENEILNKKISYRQYAHKALKILSKGDSESMNFYDLICSKIYPKIEKQINNTKNYNTNKQYESNSESFNKPKKSLYIPPHLRNSNITKYTRTESVEFRERRPQYEKYNRYDKKEHYEKFDKHEKYQKNENFETYEKDDKNDANKQIEEIIDDNVKTNDETNDDTNKNNVSECQTYCGKIKAGLTINEKSDMVENDTSDNISKNDNNSITNIISETDDTSINYNYWDQEKYRQRDDRIFRFLSQFKPPIYYRGSVCFVDPEDMYDEKNDDKTYSDEWSLNNECDELMNYEYIIEDSDEKVFLDDFENEF